jgi:hypothetical protein
MSSTDENFSLNLCITLENDYLNLVLSYPDQRIRWHHSKGYISKLNPDEKLKILKSIKNHIEDVNQKVENIFKINSN